MLAIRIQETAAALLLPLGLCIAGWARADEPSELGGFGGDDLEVVLDEVGEDEVQDVDRWWDIDGSLALSSSINYREHRSASGTGYTGLSRLRTRLNLELDFKLPADWNMRLSPYIWYDFNYLIRGRSRYTHEVLDDYEWEGDFQDSYLEGPLLENVDLKIGRQVINWGRSDSLRVLDVLNPLDNREPARADIEDLRWSVGMVRLDWQISSNWSAMAVAIPELRFDTLPPVGSDFNPLPPALDIFPTDEPDDFSDTEYGFGLTGIFEGWDFSLHFADVYEDTPSLRQVGVFAAEFYYDRLRMYGAGGNYTFGSWLFKAEAAGFDGFEFFNEPGDEKWRLDAMVGIEYYGFTDTTLAFEAVNRHIFDYNDLALGFPDVQRENSVTYAFRYTADWFHARLQTTVLAVVFGWKAQDGAILRFQGDYTLRDGLVATAGLLLYQRGDLPFLDTWGRNDRFFFDIKYSF